MTRFGTLLIGCAIGAAVMLVAWYHEPCKAPVSHSAPATSIAPKYVPTPSMAPLPRPKPHLVRKHPVRRPLPPPAKPVCLLPAPFSC